MTKAAPGPVDGIMASLAKKYAVSPGEISLRWCIDQDIVAITTSSREQRLSDYLRAMTFKLTPAEIQQVRLPLLQKCPNICSHSCVQINEEGAKKHYRGFWNHEYDDKDTR